MNFQMTMCKSMVGSRGAFSHFWTIVLLLLMYKWKERGLAWPIKRVSWTLSLACMQIFRSSSAFKTTKWFATVAVTCKTNEQCWNRDRDAKSIFLPLNENIHCTFMLNKPNNHQSRTVRIPIPIHANGWPTRQQNNGIWYTEYLYAQCFKLQTIRIAKWIKRVRVRERESNYDGKSRRRLSEMFIKENFIKNQFETN